MRKSLKIWTSEEEILAAIGRAKERQQKQLEIVQEAKARIKELIRSRKQREGDFAGIPAIGDCEKQIAKAEKSYRRVEEKTLPRLGEILAAFRTRTMPEVMGEYNGVAIR